MLLLPIRVRLLVTAAGDICTATCDVHAVTSEVHNVTSDVRTCACDICIQIFAVEKQVVGDGGQGRGVGCWGREMLAVSRDHIHSVPHWMNNEQSNFVKRYIAPVFRFTKLPFI